MEKRNGKQMVNNLECKNKMKIITVDNYPIFVVWSWVVQSQVKAFEFV